MIITAAPAVVGAAFNKMQVAWLPDAHPWLITGRAANRLFDFIDVLKIYGGRSCSEAEMIQLCLFHPSPGDCLPSSIHPPPGPGRMGSWKEGQLPPPRSTGS